MHLSPYYELKIYIKIVIVIPQPLFMNMRLPRPTKGYKFYTRRLYSTNVQKWASTNCTSLVPYGTNLVAPPSTINNW